jgi:hybrid cluster-associated redox disulfide protein
MIKKKPYVLKKEAVISDILQDCPKIAEYFVEYGLLCVACPFNRSETLEDGAKVHSMSDKNIERMIKEINKKLKNQ